MSSYSLLFDRSSKEGTAALVKLDLTSIKDNDLDDLPAHYISRLIALRCDVVTFGGSCGPVAKDAIQIAVSDAYRFLQGKDLIKGKHYYVAYFEFENVKRIEEGSIALIAALRFAQACYEEITGEKLPYSYAATGGIARNDKAGTYFVSGVNNIAQKLESAMGNLREGDKVFYPNRIDPIDAKYEKWAKDKGIELIPVDTVAEAIEKLLFSHKTIKSVEITKSRRLVWVAHLPFLHRVVRWTVSR